MKAAYGGSIDLKAFPQRYPARNTEIQKYRNFEISVFLYYFLYPALSQQKYRNTEIIAVRVLDEAQHCGKTLLTLEIMYRSRVAISYDSVGFYHMTCGV